MSMSLFSRTCIVSNDVRSTNITSADELMTVPSMKIAPRVGLKTIGQRVVTEVKGNTRGYFLIHSLQRLCELANVRDLGFMYNGDGEGAHWKLPLGIEDGEDEVYGNACGFLLDGAERGRAYAALTVLVHWVEDHLEDVALDDYMGDYGGEETIQELFDESKRCLFANARSAMYAEDGDGPGFLFAYLTSAREVMGNAVVANYPVLYVREIFF